MMTQGQWELMAEGMHSQLTVWQNDTSYNRVHTHVRKFYILSAQQLHASHNIMYVNISTSPQNTLHSHYIYVYVKYQFSDVLNVLTFFHGEEGTY